MVGCAVLRVLKQQAVKVLTANRADLDLSNQASVQNFFRQNPMDQVYLCAAKVGGIQANNQFPADFIYENLMIEANIIHASHLNDVQKLMFLGSSCIYPKNAAQPMAESALLTGALEPTNEPYAIAKIAGIKLCESYNRQYGRDYRAIMPTNLYGQFDNFHLENSHVIPGLLHRFHLAVQANAPDISIWGSGKQMREFLHVDDMAVAAVHMMDLPNAQISAAVSSMQSHINIGTGQDCSIAELARLVAKITGFSGELLFDTPKPDGAPRKLLDVSCATELGWRAEIELEDGLKLAYDWFVANQGKFRK